MQGKSKMAAALGVTPVTVHQWCDGSRPIPSARCPSIELATGGAVTCEELLPFAPWARIPDAAWPHPSGRPVLDFCKPGPEISSKAAK
jgi:DNA-binding transcriptional regulator YdaS (Cro superfamily)